MTQIFKDQLDSTKICDLTSLLALMRHEKSLMDNVEIILSKDSIKDMTDIIGSMVGQSNPRNAAGSRAIAVPFVKRKCRKRL